MCFTFRQTNPASDLHWQKITLMAFRWKVLKFLNFSNVQTSLLISSDWFRLFDKNRDGFITKKEFRWMTTSAVISHETIDCVFKRFNLESLSFSLEGSTSMRMENLTWESLQLWFKGTGGKIWNRSKEHFWGLGSCPIAFFCFIFYCDGGGGGCPCYHPPPLPPPLPLPLPPLQVEEGGGSSARGVGERTVEGAVKIQKEVGFLAHCSKWQHIDCLFIELTRFKEMVLSTTWEETLVHVLPVLNFELKFLRCCSYSKGVGFNPQSHIFFKKLKLDFWDDQGFL